MSAKNQSGKNSLSSSEKILEFRLSSGENLLTVESSSEGSVQFSSLLLDEKITSQKNIFASEQSFLIKFHFDDRFDTFFDPDQEEFDRMRLRKKMTNFVNFKRQTVQIYKYGHETAIKKLASYSNSRLMHDHMLLLFDGSSYSSSSTWKTSYVISGGSMMRNEPLIITPAERGYILGAISTVFKDRLHIFGGVNDGLKVHPLEIHLPRNNIFD